MPPAPSADQPHPLSGETLPVVLGHEFSGVVEELGEGVEGLAVGDSVVVEPLMVDGTCPACKAGKYNLCEQMGFIGISGRGGGLSEHIVVEERWVHPVGDMPLDQAAMIEPLSVALHAVKHAGVEVAFDAAGVGVVVEQLLSVLGAGGRLEVVAIHMKAVELNIAVLLTMQDRVMGSSVGYANDHAEAIELVASGKVDLAPFITSKIVVDDIVAQGFERLITNKDNEVKILVSMQ